ncbi:Zinc finger, RING/FYVE/PHD-type [Phytophthora cactorum]|nr:Zinc finger, RING/FYVE/PHD-type [Phytophthora cactorum]
MVERSDSARAAQLGELVTGRRYLLLTRSTQRLRKLSPSGSLSSAMLLFGAELMSSRVSAMIVLHFFLVAMYHAFLLLARVALGALRPLELQQTKEMLIPFVLLRCQLLVSTMEPSGHRMELGMLVAWLAALAVLRALLALTQARFQHLLTRPMTQLLLSVVIMLNLALAATCSRLGLFSDRIVHVPWFEASLMLLKTLELGVQVGFQSLDDQDYSENSEFHLLLLQTVLSGCYLVQLVDQFRVSLFDLILILNVKNATVRLLDKIKHVKLYHQVVLDLDHLFPDATPDELESVADDVCAICLKSMCTQAKKLRCGHLFHRLCLRQCLQKASVSDALAGLDPLTRMANGLGMEDHCRLLWLLLRQVCGGKCDEMTSAEPEEHHSRQPEAEAVETRQAGQQIANNNVLGEPQAQVPAGPAAFLSRWVPFPNFSFEIVRHRGGTRNFEVTQEMLQQIWEVFPQYTLEEIRADLTRTRSVERTMERILNGRLDEQRLAMEQRNTDRADMDVSGVLGDAVIDLGEDFRWSLSTLASALWGLNLPARAPVAEAAPVAPRQQADTTGDVAPADDETQRQEAEREPLLRRLERWRGERPA